MNVCTLNPNFDIMPLDEAQSPVNKLLNFEKVEVLAKMAVDLMFFSIKYVLGIYFGLKYIFC